VQKVGVARVEGVLQEHCEVDGRLLHDEGAKGSGGRCGFVHLCVHPTSGAVVRPNPQQPLRQQRKVPVATEQHTEERLDKMITVRVPVFLKKLLQSYNGEEDKPG
jgi:hypothetical protein